MSSPDQGGLRIGALSSRVGLSTHTLRAWESRYGVLDPTRSAGGYRLYSPADEARIERMKRLLAEGLAPAQAAEVVLADPTGAAPPVTAVPASSTDHRDHVGFEGVKEDLRRALDAFDEPAAQAVLDRALGDLSLNSVLRGVVVPYLADLGDRWEQGTATVAQEHFASNVLRGRLAGLARGWGAGGGPSAVLACPPGELHDLALLVFGIVLARRGWAVTYLGTSTPVEELTSAVQATSPILVVVASTDPARFEHVAAELAALAGRSTLALAGAGATASLAERLGATLLDGDPVTQAELVKATG
jgi:DNA-binding transcriptional MerR regulator